MTISVGRLTLDNPSEIEFDGRGLRLSGWLSGTSRAGVAALRESLLGYVDNPDEPAVTIMWTDDQYFNGWYTDFAISVQPIYGVSEHGTFDCQYSIDAVRLSAVGNLESVALGGYRANDHGYTASSGALPWHAPPPYSYDYYNGENAAPTTVTRSGEDSDVRVNFFTPGTVARRVVTYATHPIAYYTSCVELEYKIGSSWYPIIGRETPATMLPVALESAWLSGTNPWRIRNGIVGISFDPTSPQLNLEIFDQSTWQTFELTLHDPPIIPHHFSILRNSPERVSLRMSCFYDTATDYDIPIQVDVTLRRGARHIECRIAVNEGAKAWSVTIGGTVGTRLYADGATQSNYGSRITTASNGVMWFAFSPVQCRSGSLQSLTCFTSATSWDVAVGGIVSATSSYEIKVSPFLTPFPSLFGQYMGPMDERERVVKR